MATPKLYSGVRQLISTTTQITHSSTYHLIDSGAPGVSPLDLPTFIAKYNLWMGSSKTARARTITEVIAYNNEGSGGRTYQLDARFTSGWTSGFVSPTNDYSDFITRCAEWGITINSTPFGYSGSVTSTVTMTPIYEEISKQVKKLYGSVRQITSLTTATSTGTLLDTLSVDNTTLLNKIKSTSTLTRAIKNGGSVRDITINGTYSNNVYLYRADLFYNNGSSLQNLWIGSSSSMGNLATYLAEWGVTFTNTSGTTGTARVSITGSYSNRAKEIKKLYGSVNGQTKLIYQ